MSEEEFSVQVRFVTKLAQFRVSEAPVEIPTRLTRRGLSNVVNMLLSLDPPQPFDFLIDHTLVRESLAHYMAEHSLSTEDVITIEYILLPSSPELSDDTPQDDWVSAVCMRVAGVVASAGFDGSVKVQRGGATLQATPHTQPVTALAPLANGDHPTFVSASVDRTLRVHCASEEGLISPFVCMGHLDSVTSVASNPNGSRFVSASADSLLKLWDNPFVGYRPKSAKRSKTDDALQRTCTHSLEGHTQPVRAVTWRASDVVYSASTPFLHYIFVTFGQVQRQRGSHGQGVGWQSRCLQSVVWRRPGASHALFHSFIIIPSFLLCLTAPRSPPLSTTARPPAWSSPLTPTSCCGCGTRAPARGRS
jgi:ribosome biogenesis protein YTM1